MRAVSETANFRNRDPQGAKAAESPKREPRRYRTGRNVQMNFKATQATIDAFEALCEKAREVRGETLKMAVAAFQRELKLST